MTAVARLAAARRCRRRRPSAPPRSGRSAISSPCSPSYYVLRPLRDRWHRRRHQGAALALHRHLPHPARRAAALRRARRAAAARPLRRRRLPVLRAQPRRVLAAAQLRHRPVAVARVFFVWVSVFNLFAVAVFWSFMADLFGSEQGKRLFGFIGAGGTAGGAARPGDHARALGAARPGQPAAGRDRACSSSRCSASHRLERSAGAATAGRAREQRVVGGSALAAVPEIVRSPYLLGLAAWVACSRSARRCSISRRPTSSPRGARRGRADARLRRHRPRGRPAHAGDAGVRDRPLLEALRHRRRGRRAAGRLHRRLRRRWR